MASPDSPAKEEAESMESPKAAHSPDGRPPPADGFDMAKFIDVCQGRWKSSDGADIEVKGMQVFRNNFQAVEDLEGSATHGLAWGEWRVDVRKSLTHKMCWFHLHGKAVVYWTRPAAGKVPTPAKGAGSKRASAGLDSAPKKARTKPEGATGATGAVADLQG